MLVVVGAQPGHRGELPANGWRQAGDAGIGVQAQDRLALQLMAISPVRIKRLAFGIAITRIDATRRQAVVTVFEGIQDASLTLVRWVLSLAPVRRVLESGLARALARYVLMPLVVATALYFATPLRSVSFTSTPPL